jgi:hypothetical protein
MAVDVICEIAVAYIRSREIVCITSDAFTFSDGMVWPLGIARDAIITIDCMANNNMLQIVSDITSSKRVWPRARRLIREISMWPADRFVLVAQSVRIVWSHRPPEAPT